MAEKMEVLENTEQTMTPEVRDQLVESLQENIREAEKAGNQDMADYYKEKLKELQTPAEGGTKLGGYYAGYTDNQWAAKAKEEYIKNGDTLKYRDYVRTAAKASD